MNMWMYACHCFFHLIQSCTDETDANKQNTIQALQICFVGTCLWQQFVSPLTMWTNQLRKHFKRWFIMMEKRKKTFSSSSTLLMFSTRGMVNVVLFISGHSKNLWNARGLKCIYKWTTCAWFISINSWELVLLSTVVCQPIVRPTLTCMT